MQFLGSKYLALKTEFIILYFCFSPSFILSVNEHSNVISDLNRIREFESENKDNPFTDIYNKVENLKENLDTFEILVISLFTYNCIKPCKEYYDKDLENEILKSVIAFRNTCKNDYLVCNTKDSIIEKEILRNIEIGFGKFLYEKLNDTIEKDEETMIKELFSLKDYTKFLLDSCMHIFYCNKEVNNAESIKSFENLFNSIIKVINITGITDIKKKDIIYSLSIVIKLFICPKNYTEEASKIKENVDINKQIEGLKNSNLVEEDKIKYYIQFIYLKDVIDSITNISSIVNIPENKNLIEALEFSIELYEKLHKIHKHIGNIDELTIKLLHNELNFSADKNLYLNKIKRSITNQFFSSFNDLKIKYSELRSYNFNKKYNFVYMKNNENDMTSNKHTKNLNIEHLDQHINKKDMNFSGSKTRLPDSNIARREGYIGVQDNLNYEYKEMIKDFCKKLQKFLSDIKEEKQKYISNLNDSEDFQDFIDKLKSESELKQKKEEFTEIKGNHQKNNNTSNKLNSDNKPNEKTQRMNKKSSINFHNTENLPNFEHENVENITNTLKSNESVTQSLKPLDEKKLDEFEKVKQKMIEIFDDIEMLLNQLLEIIIKLENKLESDCFFTTECIKKQFKNLDHIDNISLVVLESICNVIFSFFYDDEIILYNIN